VNQAVVNLDQMTQQNAALVEQSTAAAQSLREQAGQLAQAVAVFKVMGSPAVQAVYQAPAVSAPRPVRAPVAAPAKPRAMAAKPAATAQPASVAAPTPAPAPAPAAQRVAAAPKATGGEGDWESF